MPDAKQDARVVLGVITRPHGVRGEVRAHRFNPASTLLLELRSAFVGAEDSAVRMSIESARPMGEADVLRLAGVGTREAAEALRGREIAVPRSELPEPEDGEYYHADLLGMQVHEAGASLGEVVAVIAQPSVDVLRIRTASGFLEIPILEPYVVGVDATARLIEVAHLGDFEPEPS